jgi:magnesium-transporting ATPase (P-type)
VGDERSVGFPTGWAWMCLVVIVLQIALVSAWGCWWGGNCWGSRLLAEVVPLVALLCLAPIALLLRSFSGRMLLASLAVSAFLMHATGVYPPSSWETRVQIERHPEMVWSWSRAPFVLSLGKP